MALPPSLKDIAALFFKLGTIGFGGPAAHMALMEEEVVRKRQWISPGEFLDLWGATNLIPGPNSTEMSIFIGHKLRRFPGLMVAGVSFIFPALCMVTVIAWAYVRYGTLPQVQNLLFGMKPVILAVVFQALWSLCRTAVKNRWLGVMGLLAMTSNFLGLPELTTIFLGGSLYLVSQRFLQGTVLPGFFGGFFWGLGDPSSPQNVGLGKIFLFFLKIGSVLYGSGYVLLAFLRADLVEKWGWLSEAQLLDAISVGQITPGPVFTTATFIGYLLYGLKGALAATVGIFLPSFVFVAVSAPFIPRMRKNRNWGIFLDGINVGSLAVMAVTTIHLVRTTLVDPFTLVLGLSCCFLLVKWGKKINSALLLLAGSLLGFLWKGLWQGSFL